MHDRPSPPLWLTLNPDWPRQLQEHDAKNGTDILTALQTFGLRTKVDNAYYDKDRVIVSEQVFVEDDTLQEEGMSAEYRVRHFIIPSLFLFPLSVPTSCVCVDGPEMVRNTLLM